MWNGWPTARRTQGRDSLPGCLFQCAADAPDSLEHYADCHCVRTVATAELGLQPLGTPAARMANFLGMHFGAQGDPDAAVLTALRTAAVYKAHCLCRHGRLRRGPAAAEAMKQALRETVRGHRRAARVYDAAQY